MELAHDVTGTGAPLVLVHGFASSRRAFDHVAPALSEHFTVIAVDLPGHGQSPPLAESASGPVTAKDLATALGAFLDSKGIDRAHLAGNSMGGWVCLEAAADGRASSVVGLCPSGLWDPPTRRDLTLIINMHVAKLTRPVHSLALRPSLVRTIAFKSACERTPTYRSALDAARAQLEATSFDACHDGMLNRRFERAADIPPTVPVTIIFGDNDRLLPAPANQIRGLAPGHARWETFWRCGHAPMWDSPGPTVEAILATARSSSDSPAEP